MALKDLRHDQVRQIVDAESSAALRRSAEADLGVGSDENGVPPSGVEPNW